jgi:hypothetical protein
MKRVILFGILIPIFCHTSCTNAVAGNDAATVYLSDTLLDHFRNRSTTETDLKLHLARYKGQDLEWLTLYRTADGKILADYCLTKKHNEFPRDMWDIFNVLRQGFKTDSLPIEHVDEAYFNRAFLELEINPAIPVAPCYDCETGNLSQVLFSDSSVLFQGNQNLVWNSFDSLVLKLLY